MSRTSSGKWKPQNKREDLMEILKMLESRYRGKTIDEVAADLSIDRLTVRIIELSGKPLDNS